MCKKIIFSILILIIIMSGNSCARNKEVILTNSFDGSLTVHNPNCKNCSSGG